MANELCICVPSYMHRTNVLIEYLNNNYDKYDSYIFISNNDPNINEYKEIESLYPNVKFVYGDWNNIAHKRQAILDNAKAMNYKNLIMIDDDVNPYKFKHIDETCRRQTSNSYKAYYCELNDIVNEFVKKQKEHNAVQVTVKTDIYIGFMTSGKYYKNKSLATGNIYLMNLDILRQHDDLCYDTTYTICEDVSFAIECLRRGLDMICLCDYGFPSTAYGNSVASNEEKRQILHLKTAQKYHIPLQLDKNDHFQLRTKFEKYYNTFELPKGNNPWEMELFRLYDTNASIDEVFNHIKFKKEFNESLKTKKHEKK